ncbi:MAG: Hpt domain-containing protein [Proteobacteria bacterium]|nr:Hpt domain-containing protein [Pseudomonadota bacterium]MBU1231260.1 Hpt domain-containing protein [Pseudomonadota bacterium]MBU1417343.1 Hpt domain-containing protein [Pseudomonadota bacterium]MBU1455296.1 Hpt domain-containing protein [Pseudomonadota bacterium]
MGEDTVDAMLPAFLTTLQNHMQNLEDALALNDPATLGRLGHALKGALLNLGLDDLADIAHTIEIEGKSGSSDADYASMVIRLKVKMAEIL